MDAEFRRQQQLRGDAGEWAANNIVPLVGEIALEMGGGRIRAKAGDGTTPYSGLPYLGEQDDVARASVGANAARLTTAETNIAALQTEAGKIPGIQANVAANLAAINGKQDEFTAGQSPGDLIQWTGIAWQDVPLGATADAILRFDGGTGRWVAVPRGPNGYVMTISPTGQPQWLPSGSVTVRALDLAGHGSIQAAFNAATPTIASGELVVVTWGGDAYIYTGGPGSGISNAVAGDFTQIGAATSFAQVADFTNPPGGATALAVSPAVLLLWAENAGWDAGTF